MVRPEKFGHLQLVYHFTIPLIPSYLLKVTKFLGKICPYEFLVMTEKNIFVFFVIKYFRFYFFLCENCKPPPAPLWKKSSPFPLNSPSKSWGPAKSPLTFLKIWLEVQLPPPPSAERGPCTLCWSTFTYQLKNVLETTNSICKTVTFNNNEKENYT